MSDNGSAYRSHAFRALLAGLGIRHIRTRPYTPRTNGKAERFIQTSLREWAHAKAYPTSNHRAHELPIWLYQYNWHRSHGSLISKPPISRLDQTRNNLLRLHSQSLSCLDRIALFHRRRGGRPPAGNPAGRADVSQIHLPPAQGGAAERFYPGRKV